MQVLTCRSPLGAGEAARVPLDVSLLAELANRSGLDPHALVLIPIDEPSAALAVDPERPLYPASTIKTPLVAAALHDIHSGRLQPEQRFLIGEEHLTANDAESPLVRGSSATLRELMQRAIERSDNVATNLLFDAVGRERATTIAREVFGLRATAFYRKLSGSEPLIHDPDWDGTHRNAHSAGDAARLLLAIARNAFPLAPLLSAMLERQIWNEKLTLGLREGDRFAHKTGDTDEVTHDAGILTTAEGRRYVLVVYTGLASNPRNNARFAPFARALREHL